MVVVNPRFSPTHTRGARTVSPTIEGRRSDALRLMLAGGVLALVGALATAWVIKRPQLQAAFTIGWTVIVIGCGLFVRGLWQFIRD